MLRPGRPGSRDDLWRSIKRRLRPGEADEAQRVIGPERIRRNREARQALDALLEMAAQFSEQNADLLLEAEAFAQRRATLLHAPHRQLVLQELELLLRELDRQVVAGNTSVEAHLTAAPKHRLLDDEEWALAWVRERVRDRPSTASTVSGRSSADGLSSRASLMSGRDSQASASSKISGGSDVSVASLEDVEQARTSLQQAFDDEYEALLEEVEEVDDQLEACARVQREANVRRSQLDPSTSGLQQLAKKLQAIVSVSADLKGGDVSSFRVTRLRRLVDSCRSTPSHLSQVAEAAGPLPAAAQAAPCNAFFDDPFA